MNKLSFFVKFLVKIKNYKKFVNRIWLKYAGLYQMTIMSTKCKPLV